MGKITPLNDRKRKTFGGTLNNKRVHRGACQQRKMSKQSVDVYEQIPSIELLNRRKRIEAPQKPLGKHV